nr:hypothetical protein Q903MT_gene5123 [Picea sitchensis]
MPPYYVKAGCPDSRRFTTGFCVFLGKNLLTWVSKKQPTLSRSSAEAEYKTLALTTSELLWLSYLLRDLAVPFRYQFLLHCIMLALQLGGQSCLPCPL